jgi:Insertion element 4 transposase N-terminal
VTHNGVVAAGGRLTDWISLGVLASSVPRDAVDDAVATAGKGAKRSDGKLPPHVMVYFAMALALFAEEDYEEVAARLRFLGGAGEGNRTLMTSLEGWGSAIELRPRARHGMNQAGCAQTAYRHRPCRWCDGVGQWRLPGGLRHPGGLGPAR